MRLASGMVINNPDQKKPQKEAWVLRNKKQ